MFKATQQIVQCSAYYTGWPSLCSIHLSLMLARERPCFLPPAVLSPHSSKLLSPCPFQAPPSHPPCFSPLAPLPSYLSHCCAEAIVVGGGSGESLIAGPVRRGSWGDLGLKHCRDPRGARVSRTVACGEGWAPGVGALGQGTFQATGITGRPEPGCPWGAAGFPPQGWPLTLPSASPFPASSSGLGSPSLAPHSAIIPHFLVEASSESFTGCLQPQMELRPSQSWSPPLDPACLSYLPGASCSWGCHLLGL